MFAWGYLFLMYCRTVKSTTKSGISFSDPFLWNYSMFPYCANPGADVLPGHIVCFSRLPASMALGQEVNATTSLFKIVSTRVKVRQAYVKRVIPESPWLYIKELYFWLHNRSMQGFTGCCLSPCGSEPTCLLALCVSEGGRGREWHGGFWGQTCREHFPLCLSSTGSAIGREAEKRR